MSDIEKIYEELKRKYKENLEKLLDEVENEKIMYYFAYAIYLLVLVIIWGITLTANSMVCLIEFALLLTVVPYMLMFGYKRRRKYEQYKKEYAKLVFKDILDNFKEIKEYNYSKGIEHDEYRKANFDRNDDIYKSKCYVKGLIDGKYQFEMANVYTRNIRMFRTDYVYIFDGTVVIMDIPKDFKERFFVEKNMKLSKKKEVEYKIHCKNKTFAETQINNELIKSIMKTKMFDKIVLKDSKIYMRLPKNVFEIYSLKEKLLSKETIDRYYNDYKEIIDNLTKIIREI